MRSGLILMVLVSASFVAIAVLAGGIYLGLERADNHPVDLPPVIAAPAPAIAPHLASHVDLRCPYGSSKYPYDLH